MFTYHIAPIDTGWENLRTVDQTIEDLDTVELRANPKGYGPAPDVSVDDFEYAWGEAKELAYGAGWEGDFKHDPVVFWVPVTDGFQYGFVFKQDNNGSTFVVSPVPMPWFD